MEIIVCCPAVLALLATATHLELPYCFRFRCRFRFVFFFFLATKRVFNVTQKKSPVLLHAMSPPGRACFPRGPPAPRTVTERQAATAPALAPVQVTPSEDLARDQY